MIDVDMSFVNISANNDDNNSPLGQNFGRILAEFWHMGDNRLIYNFGQIFKLLNIILDQFMDCNAIIDHYTHMAVHKLDQNCVQKLQFSENSLHMDLLDSNEGSHCFFFQFLPPGAL